MGKRSSLSYFYSLLLVAVVSGLGEVLQRFVAPTNLVMLYLLAVVVAAIWWGLGPSVFVAAWGVLSFDFLFVPPRFTLAIHDLEYIVTFIVMFVVGLVISTLTVRMRQQAEEARQVQVLRETEKLQTALFNSISHDLRTPLVSVTGALSSLVQDKNLDQATQEELLLTAYEQAQRLNVFVGDLLDTARLEAGALRVSKKLEEVRDLVGTALARFEEPLKDRKVTVDIPADLPHIPMDFSLMLKVLVNVLDNAIKYSPFHLPIDIQAQVVDHAIQIKVADRGLGIPEDDLKRVFEKFYRVQRPKNVEGTGLGLSICKGIVEAHGGKIQAENRPGGGTVMTIAIPVAP